MKKSIVLIGWFLVVFCVVFINQGYAERVILDTSFDDTPVGTLPEGFRIKYNGKGNSYQVVTNAKSYSSPNSLQVWGVYGWCSNVEYDFDVFANNYVEVSWKMFAIENNNGWTTFINDNGAAWGWGYCGIGAKIRDGKVLFGRESYDLSKLPLQNNDWNKMRVILNTQTSECVAFVNDKKYYESKINFDTEKVIYTLYFLDGTSSTYETTRENPRAYHQVHGIMFGDCYGEGYGDYPTYFDDLKIVGYDFNPLDNEEESVCNDRYDEGFEAGKDYCVNNPAACGISTNGGYDDGYEAGKQWCMAHPEECGIDVPVCENSSDGQSVANFDLLTNTLFIPNFENRYWLKFGITSWDPVQLELKQYGQLE